MKIDYNKIYPKILNNIFPDKLIKEKVEKILSQYGTQSFHKEIPRIKTAILKVAGADFAELNRCIDIACCDYRDILCMAEYPNQSKCWRLKDKQPKKYQQLVEKDLNQYNDWIEENLSV